MPFMRAPNCATGPLVGKERTLSLPRSGGQTAWLPPRRSLLRDDPNIARRGWTEYPEHANPVGRADVHTAVCDGRRDELVARAERITTVRRLARVVQLVREVAGIVRVQHCRIPVLDGPDDSVRRPQRGDAWRRARKPEGPRACRDGR